MTLIDRLSKLEGPCGALLSVQLANQSSFKNEEWEFFIEALKGSVDAAIALTERVLPDHDYIIGKTNGGLTIHAQVGPNEMEFGANAAIALLIALLRAKEASK